MAHYEDRTNKEDIINTLASQCSDEYIQFLENSIQIYTACYELFRHALEFDNAFAFGKIFQIYQSQVKKWILQHSYSRYLDQSPEHFISVTFSAFYFSLRSKPIAAFPDLAHLLKYLKMCVHTALVQHVRASKKRQIHQTLTEEVTAKPAKKVDESDRILQHIHEIITDPDDRLIVRLVFIEERKPAEIAELYPQHWDSPRAVSIALYRIRRNLRNDPLLREWAGVTSSDKV